MFHEPMLTYPTVFAVGNCYQIFLPFSAEAIMWVKVGDQVFYDHCNGILRSNTNMHRVEVPMEVLDAAKSYTVVYKKMINRKPYFPTSEPEESFTVAFSPVPTEGEIRLYHIADAHNLVAEPIRAARYFGKPDLLVLNGDIPNHSGAIENFNAICEIASGVTEGTCPVVFARGNHDTRGIFAEEMPNYIPTQNGCTYYTFRVGSVWGMVLDCGEDKDDTHAEYGGTVCFHAFRLQETAFIRGVIARAAKEYAAEGVKHKLVISHVGFTHAHRPPFDIEEDLYKEWSRLMREEIQPDLLLYGHYHKVLVSPVGSEFDNFGQACTAVVGAQPFLGRDGGEKGFVGCGITLRTDGKKQVLFQKDTGEIFADVVVE